MMVSRICHVLLYYNEHERYLKILCTSNNEKYFMPWYSYLRKKALQE